MSKWIIYLNRHNYQVLTQRNLQTDVTFTCGSLRADTAPETVLGWIVSTAAARPGDVINYAGTTMLLMPLASA